MEVAHFTEEGLVVDLVSFEDGSEFALELGVVLDPLLFVLLDLLQEFLKGVLCISQQLLSCSVMKTFSAASSLPFQLPLERP